MQISPQILRCVTVKRRSLILACAVAASLATPSLRAGEFNTTKTTDATIDTEAWVGTSSAPYGRAMNGNSFETSTLTTHNGYQYTAYWKNVSNQGRVSMARRAIGSTVWDKMTLTNAFSNSTNANDAHNVISLGIAPSDGTVHIAYDMHGHTLRYRQSVQGLTTNPGSFTWNTANAGALMAVERNNLTGPAINGVTYPMFIRSPNNNLQVAFRLGSSGNGSWSMYDYNGTTHAWSNGHQIDDGTVGTYVGTTTASSPTRNNYPNNFTYGADGRLHSTFTWRESATGAANHDILYVYSEDNGNTWKNNAGTIVGSQSAGTKFQLNSPGLIVRPLAESQTLMNQNGQSVDHESNPHAIVWHRDSAKDPSLNAVWEPQESSYFQYWRDDVGNWHQNKLNGNVGTRPKIMFDANDNAIAIYQVATGGASSGTNLYPSNGDLVIAAATKASNWTDWKIIKTETGPFLTEAQADPELLESTGTLSIVMQGSPTLTTNAGTVMRSLDYSLAFTPASAGTFTATSGDWDVAGNWNGSSVPGSNKVIHIDGNRTATVDAVVPTLDNVLVVGGAGSAGTLNVVSGGSLNLLSNGLFGTVYGGSIVVGRNGGAVGTYNQTGGTVNAWRFAVGDYFNETSGGGASSATISGGTLTTYELNVAFSANGSSSGSSFNIAGGNVIVNGDAIVGEFGNAGSINLSSGLLQVEGHLREGFNKTNTSTFRMNGGTLNMTLGYVTVDNFIYNGGTLQNISTISSQLLSGISVGTLLVGPNLGVGSTALMTLPTLVRTAASNRVEVWSGATLTLGTSAALAIGTTPSFTTNQINITAGGTLAGDGTITNAVNNSAGVIAPGHSIGTLKLKSNYTQGASARMEIELGAAGNDTINITGTASLAGTLRVLTFDGFTPLPGQSFNVLNFASRSGDVTLDNQTGYAGLVLTKSYTSTGLTLNASALFSGDANLDGTINTTDFTALATHFNESGMNWLAGDFNGDSIVNALDFNAIASNYGAGASPALGAVVPEPSSLFSIALLINATRRRRAEKI